MNNYCLYLNAPKFGNFGHATSFARSGPPHFDACPPIQGCAVCANKSWIFYYRILVEYLFLLIRDRGTNVLMTSLRGNRIERRTAKFSAPEKESYQAILSMRVDMGADSPVPGRPESPQRSRAKNRRLAGLWND
ncbi:MAG: hypothetical protein V3S23_04345, partial [Kiloniellales bacterium]